MRRNTKGETNWAANAPSGNPYAHVQNETDPKPLGQAQLSLSFSSGPAQQPDAVGDARIDSAPIEIDGNSGNPYASLCAMDDTEWDAPVKKADGMAIKKSNAAGDSRKPQLSKKDFSDEARRIFLQYIPELEGNRLRPQHIEFIQRNAPRKPEERYQVLERLKRYDLKDAGVRGHFNREDSDLTALKLAEIEKLD